MTDLLDMSDDTVVLAGLAAMPSQAASALAPPVRIDHADPRHARVVLVDWMLGNACSYACSYCPKELHDGSIAWQDEAAILALYDRLADHYQSSQGRTVWLQFTGGEPTMHPRFPSIVEAAAARGFRVSLISNASRTHRFWKRIRPHLDAAILTYHPEFATPEPFIATLRLLSEVMPVHVNVTMPPDRFEAVFAEADAIAEAVPTITIALKPLRVGFRSELYPYTDAQKARLDTRLTRKGHAGAETPRGILRVTGQDGQWRDAHVHELMLAGANHWKGWLCNAGLESLRIKGDGRITRAVCSAGGEIGRLGGDVNLPELPVSCDRETCACVADILITKVVV
jgi:organic radical activating enzyme